MSNFTYVEQMLMANGHADHCSELPIRCAGHSPEHWLEHVRDVAQMGINARKWDLNFAQDMVFNAQLMCAELKRYPDMIAWEHYFYSEAAGRGISPLDRDGLALIRDAKFFDDDRPLDAETKAFLKCLMDEEEAA